MVLRFGWNAAVVLIAGRNAPRRRSCADDAEVFKLYSQAKLGMMREALAKLDRKANESAANFFTSGQVQSILVTFFARSAKIRANCKE